MVKVSFLAGWLSQAVIFFRRMTLLAHSRALGQVSRGFHRRWLHYEQGQDPVGVREYFYSVDFNGYLFLDDARIKNFTSRFKGKKKILTKSPDSA
jgi:hypothetical protein